MQARKRETRGLRGTQDLSMTSPFLFYPPGTRSRRSADSATASSADAGSNFQNFPSRCSRRCGANFPLPLALGEKRKENRKKSITIIDAPLVEIHDNRLHF